MLALRRELRKSLENVIAEARNVAEKAAEKAVEALAVREREPYKSMTVGQKALRNRLRAHSRQLGDLRNAEKSTQQVNHLVAECAYEHWHRILFARFLAENQLLLEPESGVAIAIDEVKEMARTRAKDWVVLAGEFAVQMLPQVFRQHDPVLEVEFAPEDRKRLEELVEGLSVDVFTASDSLGWTYQFWQAERKGAINVSEVKIGAEELPAVTQLFTEDYMVDFLLDNTLGAWHAGRILAVNPGLGETANSEEELREAFALPGCPWKYLRFIKGEDGAWAPAAGAFATWPKTARELTCLDPCMGSGHFVVAMFERMVALRMADEKMSQMAAVAGVIRDNVFGLEIDPRCTQIGAFNLALAAWRRVGYCNLPAMNVACSGLAPNTREADWLAIVGTDEKLKNGMARLYHLFRKAATLGSLIDPRAGEGDLLVAKFDELQLLMERALAQDDNGGSVHEIAVTARGLAKAAEILISNFTLVATNVPYLGRNRQQQFLKDYSEHSYPESKQDLATCFVERCLEFCSRHGVSALVTPQSWLFQDRYADLRRRLLTTVEWRSVIQLGAHAFDTISGERVNVSLLTMGKSIPGPHFEVTGLNVASAPSVAEKATAIRSSPIESLAQRDLLNNPDSRIVLEDLGNATLLLSFANSWQGIKTSDDERFTEMFWEQPRTRNGWWFYQRVAEKTTEYSGREEIVFWEDGLGTLTEVCQAGASFRGKSVWNKAGVAVSMMGDLPATLYTGEKFSADVSIIEPKDPKDLSAVWAFCSSQDYSVEVRKIDRALRVTNSAMAKIPFDLVHWQKVAAEKYPNELPKPFSSDPTQWLFNGHPADADSPLQVAVARLLSYQWPRQTGSSFPDCPALDPDGLGKLADDDGIVPLSSAKGEPPAAERLREILGRTYGKDWSAARQEELLAENGNAGEMLEDWLRDGFFEQHCALFHKRPFIWHIWDGERDGFHALVNYHKLAAPNGLGRQTLDKLTYVYLGDWISRQKAEQRQGKEGAEAKLSAALYIQEQLKKIIDGEPPYDLFVRWKPLHEQAIGWEPDINDGVRMNIRPFMMAQTLRGKSIFRKAPKIKWEKDRGNEPERPKKDFPWFWTWDEESADFTGGRAFDGKRWNDLHYSNNTKHQARESKEKRNR